MATQTGKPAPVRLPAEVITDAVATLPSYLGVIIATVSEDATWTLPPIDGTAPQTPGAFLFIKNVTSHQITLNTSNSDTIDGASSYVIAKLSVCQISVGASNTNSWEVTGLSNLGPDLTIPGNLAVGGTSTFAGEATFNAAATFNAPATLASMEVEGASTFDGLVTFNAPIAPVNATLSPGTADFPTLQSIFDFLRGRAVDNVLIDLQAPTSGLKVINENLVMRDILSCPSQGQAMPLANYPFQDPSELTLVQPGLSLRGDPRYAAGMHYIDGAQLNYFNDANSASTGYVIPLGTPYGLVNLVRPAAGQIQVVITAAPPFDPENNTGPVFLEQPDFAAADVQPNDHILIRTDTGTWAEFTITAVQGNILTYNGDVTALGATAQLVLLPRVKVVNTVPQPSLAGVYIGVGITIQGIWFQNPLDGDVMDLFENADVKLQQCVIDGRLTPNGGFGTVVGFNGRLGTEVSTIRMHNSYVCGGAAPFGIYCIDGGIIDDGDFVISDPVSTGAASVECTTASNYNSLQIVHPGSAGVNVSRTSRIDVVTLYSVYNSGGTAIRTSSGSTFSLTFDNLQISGAATGISASQGALVMIGAGSGAPALYNSQIVGTTTACVNAASGSSVIFNNTAAVALNNAANALRAQDNGRIVFGGNITWGGSLTRRRAFDATSHYSANSSTETPGNVLTLAAGASVALDCVVPTQLVSAATTSVTLDPTSTGGGALIYVGKRFNLRSSDVNSFTLVLSNATFVGEGAPAGASNTLTFNSSAPIAGAGVDFTVLSTSLVMINHIVNGAVSVTMPVATPKATASLVEPPEPQDDLGIVGRRYMSTSKPKPQPGSKSTGFTGFTRTQKRVQAPARTVNSYAARYSGLRTAALAAQTTGKQAVAASVPAIPSQALQAPHAKPAAPQASHAKPGARNTGYARPVPVKVIKPEAKKKLP